ncbi:DUF1629 domain-containing protein [uncultured Flavobacterium sp.]|uniref:imm11 family protein n=1 Tax=uncultured Flavobacterium sp. TaxID=165435 RepID=UPI0025DEAADE|nr:DUF1629 domain-containing protein [uncultured Flavobacterium sp.]
MKYFSINNSLNPKVLGHYPQVKEIKQNCDVWNEPKFIEHVNFEKIDFEPITANAILHPKSKLTDLISVTGMGFTRKLLISGLLKTILENNRGTGLQFFQSNLIYKNEEIEHYWILNSFEIDMNLIDIQKSNFVWRKRKEEGGTYLLDVKFNSLDEFCKKIVNDNLEGKLYINKLAIKEQASVNFFTLLNVEGAVKYIVSENLKKEIEDAGTTGIEFQPVELSYQEWSAPGGERERIYGKL